MDAGMLVWEGGERGTSAVSDDASSQMLQKGEVNMRQYTERKKKGERGKKEKKSKMIMFNMFKYIGANAQKEAHKA